MRPHTRGRGDGPPPTARDRRARDGEMVATASRGDRAAGAAAIAREAGEAEQMVW
ncbi:hypothetical protein Scep_022221 [Stephania cephalantha]|uniref:Uncharacterized protein n=1 Tax=Stephania cephalantha TaxID=152367 RepID=A0AAP0FAG9_9MAGN